MTLAAKIESGRAQLATLPRDIAIDQRRRPVVVVAWNGRGRKWVGCRYHIEAVGDDDDRVQGWHDYVDELVACL